MQGDANCITPWNGVLDYPLFGQLNLIFKNICFHIEQLFEVCYHIAVIFDFFQSPRFLAVMFKKNFSYHAQFLMYKVVYSCYFAASQDFLKYSWLSISNTLYLEQIF